MEATIYSALGMLLGIYQSWKGPLTGEQKAAVSVINAFLVTLVTQVVLSLAGVAFVQDSEISAYGYTFAASQLTHLIMKYGYPRVQAWKNGN